MREEVGKAPLPGFIGEGLILQKENPDLNLDNFIPAARGYPEFFSYAFLRRESGENVKGYRWEAPFAGTITNYLLRLNA